VSGSRLIIPREFYAALTSTTQHPSTRRGSAASGTEALLGELYRVLQQPIADHLGRRSLSFSSSRDLVYPSAKKEVSKLIHANTLVLQGLERCSKVFASLVLNTAHEVDRPVSATAYFSSPESQAFGWHTDEWDSVIWQLGGTKQFEFREAPAERLTAGDMLYMHRGVVHRTKTLAQSAHVSLVVFSAEKREELKRAKGAGVPGLADKGPTPSGALQRREQLRTAVCPHKPPADADNRGGATRRIDID
jgi:quercetin dioxygenase-like cupin family protein